LYETIRVAVSEQVRAEVAHKGLARSQIVVLDALLKLRQACCDPRLVNLERAKSVSENAKLEWLEENLPTFLEDGRRILLFSAFATLLGNLEPSLDKLGIAYSKLTGQTKDRAQQIERFQDGETSVFLISLKAGGVGLNLTAADTVIHFDPWWNPAAEDQASSRAHRIGQTKKVFVYKLITQGSLEEKILELQKRKAELAKGILEGGLHSATALGQEDLDALLAPLG
jgi:SNF2 family DNA or RNA helicase